MEPMTQICSCGICFVDNKDCGTSDYLLMTNNNAFLAKAHLRYMQMRNVSDALKWDASNFRYSSKTKSTKEVNIKKKGNDTCLFALFV